MPEITTIPPPIEWAQRADILFVTVVAECKDVEHKFTEESLHFKATSVDQNRQYEATLNFLHKINPEKVVTKNTTRCIEFTITKAAAGPYWTSLTNDKKKPHFVKADFNKWRDEDDDEEEEAGPDGFNNMENMFAGLNTAGAKPGFDDLEDEQEDSDDEELPNLE